MFKEEKCMGNRRQWKEEGKKKGKSEENWYYLQVFELQTSLNRNKIRTQSQSPNFLKPYNNLKDKSSKVQLPHSEWLSKMRYQNLKLIKLKWIFAVIFGRRMKVIFLFEYLSIHIFEFFSNEYLVLMIIV